VRLGEIGRPSQTPSQDTRPRITVPKFRQEGSISGAQKRGWRLCLVKELISGAFRPTFNHCL